MTQGNVFLSRDEFCQVRESSTRREERLIHHGAVVRVGWWLYVIICKGINLLIIPPLCYLCFLRFSVHPYSPPALYLRR
jgi:hypothetical protein